MVFMMLRRIVVVATSVIVALGIGMIGMGWLIRLRQPPPQQMPPGQGKLVRVMRVQPQDVPLTVEGFGSVRPKTEWRIVSEVSGPVVVLAPFMRSGLHVKQGELLFEIDPQPYQLAAQRSRAQIERARNDIAVLRQQARNNEATLRIAERNLAIAEAELQRDEALVQKGTVSARERD
jgi:multidrug efflux pump subunit AcrA (membrane-fusion protein)